MWEFIFGAVVGVALCCVHGYLIGKKVQRLKKDCKTLIDEKQTLMAQNHRFELDIAYQQGYNAGRNDPRKEVEILAETLTKTGNGVVKFARKQEGG